MKRALDTVLWLLLVLSIAGLFLANEDGFWRTTFCQKVGVPCFGSDHAAALNKIFYDISVGSVTSLFFYVLIVRLPEYERRRRLKRSFAKQYQAIKRGAIATMLSAVGRSYDAALPTRLSDQKAFRDYFKEDDRWSAFANGLDSRHIGEIVGELELLRDEIAYALNNTDVASEETVDFFKRLSGIIYRYRTTSPDYDDVKSFCRFLWELFAGWDWVEGYRKRDIVQHMIDDI